MKWKTHGGQWSKHSAGLVGWERVVLGVMIQQRNLDLKWKGKVSEHRFLHGKVT